MEDIINVITSIGGVLGAVVTPIVATQYWQKWRRKGEAKRLDAEAESLYAQSVERISNTWRGVADGLEQRANNLEKRLQAVEKELYKCRDTTTKLEAYLEQTKAELRNLSRLRERKNDGN